MRLSQCFLLLAGAHVANCASETCHSVSPQVTDDWCNVNCNFSPPNCPAQYCECGAPPSPGPGPAPGPGPQPTPAPTPAPGPSPAPPRPSGSIDGFFLAPYASSSAGAAPSSAKMAVYFWGMPPSQWSQFVKMQPDAYTVDKLLPGPYYYKVLNLGGGGTAWTDGTISSAKDFLPTIKKLGFNGVCFDTEVFGQFTMPALLDLFKATKAMGLTTVLTSTAEGPYSGCDSPNDCWKDIIWDDVDFMVPQMYGPSGANYGKANMDKYANFWKVGGGQGVHGKFPGPNDLTKILWAVQSGTGASQLSDYPFAGGYVEWAYHSLGARDMLV